jgi:predicted nucleic acid-binding protein
MILVLDTFPTSSVAKRPGKSPTLSDRCRQWVQDCEAAGHTVLIPAIAYYEALRELEQRQAAAQAQRLRTFCLRPDRFIPLTTAHLETAAELWGQARRGGRPTASDDALDGDVILAAQALSLGLAASDYVVATTNVGHLSRFVPADEWTNITP